MGFFSWDCQHCGMSAKSGPGLPKELTGQQNVVVLLVDGGKVEGEYDGYGRVIGEDYTEFLDNLVDIDGKFSLFHSRCWRAAGCPQKFLVPSEYSSDQGYFYDDEAAVLHALARYPQDPVAQPGDDPLSSEPCPTATAHVLDEHPEQPEQPVEYPRAFAISGIEPGNPYLSDLYHMGTPISKNVEAMFATDREGNTSYVILVDKTTGRRVKVEFSDCERQNHVASIMGAKLR